MTGDARGSPRDADVPAPRNAADRGSPRDAERPLRLFVALELPDPVRDALAAVGAAADRGAWRPVAAASLHLTLVFLGSRPPGDVAIIAGVLDAETGSPAPRLALRDALLLPPRRPRVLTVALDDPGGTLAALQLRVSDGLAAAGVYTPEKRPFRAHITVARLRPHARNAPAPELDLDAALFVADRLTLFQSQLHPKGARYTALTSAMLAD